MQQSQTFQDGWFESRSVGHAGTLLQNFELFVAIWAPRFNGKFRDECLNLHRFQDLADSRVIIKDWRTGYNRARPHSSLGYVTPLEFKWNMHRNLSLTVV